MLIGAHTHILSLAEDAEFTADNPAYRGPKAAVRELERAVTGLGLAGLKLYPMYQDWSPADPVTAFPVFARAEELGIPVMVHQAGSTRIDARMEYARPALLDAAGRHFRELRLTIAHCGLYDPVELRAKLLSVNDYAERVGAAPIPQAKLDGIMGGNYARMLGLL